MNKTLLYLLYPWMEPLTRESYVASSIPTPPDPDQSKPSVAFSIGFIFIYLVFLIFYIAPLVYLYTRWKLLPTSVKIMIGFGCFLSLDLIRLFL